MRDFFIQKLRRKFTDRSPIDFNVSLPKAILNIEDKNRSNLFSWRGQFSPQLIENLLFSYCPRNATVLDPFSGSGTVLYESACFGLTAFGGELNPAAWILSRVYELANQTVETRKKLLDGLRKQLEHYFPQPQLFCEFGDRLIEIVEFDRLFHIISDRALFLEKIILDALVILLDISENSISSDRIYKTFFNLSQIIENLPVSEASISALLCDSRNLQIEDESINFVITSPPYINVFNYHQNYRRSTERLGWNLLQIARSEIGSNRANRANRFYTVIQYCLDMALTMRELQRVCQIDSRAIFVVGYSSNVLETPFYNSEILLQIAQKTEMFEVVCTQTRTFKNKFGKSIVEDLIHLTRKNSSVSVLDYDRIAREVAIDALKNGLKLVSDKNKNYLLKALEQVAFIAPSPLCNLPKVDRPVMPKIPA